jgi:DNA-binding transcriptional LysR family regulator
VEDLNDLYYFAKVVDHGGFAAAGRALGIPKSKLSRRVAELEERLGVRLLQRSSRRFAVTEIGQVYHRHCTALVAEAAAAREAVAQVQSEPQGILRVSCPMPLIRDYVMPVVVRFLAQHPRVRLTLHTPNRPVDVIEEGYDLAIRVRMPPLEDSGLTIRILESHGSYLVASPSALDRWGRPDDPDCLAALPTLDLALSGGVHVWRIIGSDGGERSVRVTPRLASDHMGLLTEAALNGLGIARLPRFLVREGLHSGALERVLPDWNCPAGIVHAVFPSRRGLVPAVRLFLDELAKAFDGP